MLSYLVNRPSAITYSGALLCDLCSAHDNDSCPVASLQCQGCTLSPTATPNGSRDHSNTPKDSVHNTATTAEHCFGNSRDDAVASDDVDGAVVTTPTSPYQPRVIQPTDAFAISSAFDKYGWLCSPKLQGSRSQYCSTLARRKSSARCLLCER